MLLPALSSARKRATLAACLNNLKQIGSAVIMYADANDDQIVPTVNYANGQSVEWGGGFWGGPYPGPAITGPTEAQAEAQVTAQLTGNNPLAPFCGNAAAYHCPGDTRYLLRFGRGWAYDSYSKTQNFGGDTALTYWGQGSTYRKLAEARIPSMTFSFTEDADSRGFNEGTWVVQWNLANGSFGWVDVPTMYHGNVGSFLFADGHAEAHRWLDGACINAGLQSAFGRDVFYFSGPSSGPDYSWIREHWRFPGWK
jgi:prepilin-type processing-associated H-X9-DG protein